MRWDQSRKEPKYLTVATDGDAIMTLNGKRIVVLGGSSGIGLAMPRHSGTSMKALILAAFAVFSLCAGAADTQGMPSTIKPQAAAVHQASYDPFASSDDWANG
jgi:hypothetical protein